MYTGSARKGILLEKYTRQIAGGSQHRLTNLGSVRECKVQSREQLLQQRQMHKYTLFLYLRACVCVHIRVRGHVCAFVRVRCKQLKCLVDLLCLVLLAQSTKRKTSALPVAVQASNATLLLISKPGIAPGLICSDPKPTLFYKQRPKRKAQLHLKQQSLISFPYLHTIGAPVPEQGNTSCWSFPLPLHQQLSSINHSDIVI